MISQPWGELSFLWKDILIRVLCFWDWLRLLLLKLHETSLKHLFQILLGWSSTVLGAFEPTCLVSKCLSAHVCWIGRYLHLWVFNKQWRKRYRLFKMLLSHTLRCQLKVGSLLISKIVLAELLLTWNFTEMILETTILAWSRSKWWIVRDWSSRRHKAEHALDSLLLLVKTGHKMFDMYCNCPDLSVSINHSFHNSTIFCLNKHSIIPYASTATWSPWRATKRRLSS